MRKAIVTSKGQVTIPAEVRTALGVSQGDAVSFELRKDGSVVLRIAKRESPFAKYAGKLSQGTGRTAKQIVEELREARGW